MDSMEDFLDMIKPIILSAIQEYGYHIKGAEWEDLIQEGRLAALEGLNNWKTGGEKPKAGLKAWVTLYIISRFKELAKRGYIAEIFVEDIETLPAEPQTMGSEETEIEAEQDVIRTCLYDTLPEYASFLERMLDYNLSQVSVAKDMGRTRQRISQLKKEVLGVYGTKRLRREAQGRLA